MDAYDEGHIRQLLVELLESTQETDPPSPYTLPNLSKCSFSLTETCFKWTDADGWKRIAIGMKDMVAFHQSLLQLMIQLLSNHYRTSTRDVYYLQPALYKNVTRISNALHHIAAKLEIPRYALPIDPKEDGIIAGHLTWRIGGKEVQLSSFLEVGVFIPSNPTNITHITSSASKILIIEDHASFQRLLHSSFFSHFPNVLLLTGRGEPSYPVRYLIYKLRRSLPTLQIFILTDFDPYGFEIMTTYKYGSRFASYMPYLASPHLIWLGAHKDTFLGMCDLSQCLLPCNPTQLRKIQLLKAHPALTIHKEWLSHLLFMEQYGNIQLEALFSQDMNGLFTFLSSHPLFNPTLMHINESML